MNDDYYQFLPAVMAICSAAGELILSLKEQNGTLNVAYKSNNTPVTTIDIATNDFMFKLIICYLAFLPMYFVILNSLFSFIKRRAST